MHACIFKKHFVLLNAFFKGTLTSVYLTKKTVLLSSFILSPHSRSSARPSIQGEGASRDGQRIPGPPRRQLALGLTENTIQGQSLYRY